MHTYATLCFVKNTVLQLFKLLIVVLNLLKRLLVYVWRGMGHPTPLPILYTHSDTEASFILETLKRLTDQNTSGVFVLLWDFKFCLTRNYEQF